MLHTASAFLSRWLWPDRCVSCGIGVPETTVFCAACEISVVAIDTACPGCALISTCTKELCRTCQARPFPFQQARAQLVYGGSVADAIVRFKHGRQPAVARPLARLLIPTIDWAVFHGMDAIVPVPLHPRRLRKRGFNQSLELAREATTLYRRQTGNRTPAIWFDSLLRARDTPPLGHEPPAVRRCRVAGAFAVVRAKALEGRRLLVLDDVMTTGATLAECALTLIRAGAKEVFVAALARAL